MPRSTPSPSSPFGRAQWIWPQDHRWDLHNAYVLFRHAFPLDRVPRRAPLFITADQSYQLYLNGAFVGRGPARGFQSHWPYDEIDVARWLVPGRNVIAIRAHNPGLSNFQYVSQSYAGLLVSARWNRVVIQTDATWRCVPQPGIRRDTVQSSHQLFSQEHYDAREGLANWMDNDFDDGAWIHPAVWDQGKLPWLSLESRGIPHLFEEAWRPGRVIGIGEGDCGQGWEQARNLYLLRQNEAHGHAPADTETAALAGPAHPDAPVGLHATDIEVPPTGGAKFRSYLIDVGRPVVGSFSLQVGGARGGEMIDIIYLEDVDFTKLEPRMAYPDSSRVTFSTRLICRPGRTAHRYYHPFGFRYAMLTVRDSHVPLHVTSRLHRTGYPVERRGRFQSSDPVLTQIWETCAWSQQNCMLDAYVDTPWREQAQWWGDARVQAWNTFHLSGDARLFHRGIRQIGAQTTADGVTYGHAPTMAHNCVLPDFTLIWIITLWDYYWQTGDLELFKSQRPVIERALKYFEAHTGKHGLAEYDSRYWLFLDWTDLFKEGAPTVYNLWLLIALEKLAELHRLTRNPAAANHCQRRATRLRQRLRALVDRRGLLRDGIDWQGRIVKSTSPHAQVLALMTDLIPASSARMEQFLVDYLRDESKHTAKPSAYWITYVYSILAERGHGAAVVEHIRPRWAPMIAYGSTFEVFSQSELFAASRSHAWSAHPLFHLMQIIGGVRQTAPAWREVSFAPVFHGEHGGCTIPRPPPSSSPLRPSPGLLPCPLGGCRAVSFLSLFFFLLFFSSAFFCVFFSALLVPILAFCCFSSLPPFILSLIPSSLSLPSSFLPSFLLLTVSLEGAEAYYECLQYLHSKFPPLVPPHLLARLNELAAEKRNDKPRSLPFVSLLLFLLWLLLLLLLLLLLFFFFYSKIACLFLFLLLLSSSSLLRVQLLATALTNHPDLIRSFSPLPRPLAPLLALLNLDMDTLNYLHQSAIQHKVSPPP